MKLYRLSDDSPKPSQDVPGAILLAVVGAFLAGCIAAVLWGR